MIGVCFLKQLVKHCSKSRTRPDMAPTGGLKVELRPDLPQWTRCPRWRSWGWHGDGDRVTGTATILVLCQRTYILK